MAAEFLICIPSSELPLDGSAQRVSSGLPGIDFALQELRIRQATVQALATENADLYLCDVEPTRVLEGGVESSSRRCR